MSVRDSFGQNNSPFGSSSTPAYGASFTQTRPLGSSDTSAFGQKPAFEPFGMSPAQTSPFGGTTQPSQPPFGSNMFGAPYIPFGSSWPANTIPAFGYGSTNTSAFGTTTYPGIGSQATPAFTATSASPIGSTSTPAFGAPSTPNFVPKPTPSFGSTESAFGTTSSSLFETGGPFGTTSSTPGFGQSSSFGPTSASTFGQSSTTFGSNQFGAASPFGGQSSTFGPQFAPPTLGNTAFGTQAAQRVGSRVTPYQVTSEPDSNVVGKLMSISAMAAYKEQSQEELRWEDYQSGDTGGSFRSVGDGFDHSTVQKNPLNPIPATSFPQSSSSPFNTSTSSSLFAPKTSSFPSSGPFNSSTSSSFFVPKTSSFPSDPFNTSTSSSLFSPNTSSYPSTGSGVTSPSPISSTSPFGSSSTQTNFFAPTLSAPTSGQTSPPFHFSSAPSFSFSTSGTSSTPSFSFPIQSNPQTQFGQTGTTSSQLGNIQPASSNGGPSQPGFGTTSSSTLGTITINQSSGTSITITPTSATTITITPSSGSTTVTIAPFSDTTSTSTSGHAPFPYPFVVPSKASQPIQTSTSIFNTTNSFDQTQPGDRSSFSPSLFGRSQNNSEPWFGSVCPATNPFNMLPERPQISFGHTAPSPSFQDGVSGSVIATRDLRESVQNQTDVSLRITKELLSTKGKEKNMVYSPLSIHVVLSLIAAGSTKGLHQEEMLKFLKSKSTEQLNELASNLVPLVFADGTPHGGPCLSFANGVWVDMSLPVKTSFKEVLDNAYKAVLKQVDFRTKSEEARREVNSWVEKETRGLVQDLLPCGTVNNSTRIILANALYFKGAWDQKFIESRTDMFDFHLLSGRSVKAPFMTSWEKQFISVFDSFKVLKLPYKQGDDLNRRFSMYMFLPNASNGLSSLVEKVCSEAGLFDRYLPLRKVEVGAFLIPKFKITFGFEACQVLEPLGLKLPFLSETVVGDHPAVNLIFHKSFIEVNEEGTEAAAATAAVSMFGSAGPLPVIEKIDFVADHPFLFLIREEVTGAVMFIGHVLDPVSD